MIKLTDVNGETTYINPDKVIIVVRHKDSKSPDFVGLEGGYSSELNDEDIEKLLVALNGKS